MVRISRYGTATLLRSGALLDAISPWRPMSFQHLKGSLFSSSQLLEATFCLDFLKPNSTQHCYGSPALQQNEESTQRPRYRRFPAGLGLAGQEKHATNGLDILWMTFPVSSGSKPLVRMGRSIRAFAPATSFVHPRTVNIPIGSRYIPTTLQGLHITTMLRDLLFGASTLLRPRIKTRPKPDSASQAFDFSFFPRFCCYHKSTDYEQLYQQLSPVLSTSLSTFFVRVNPHLSSQSLHNDQGNRDLSYSALISIVSSRLTLGPSRVRRRNCTFIL